MRSAQQTLTPLCTSHYQAVLREYPDANMSAFRESKQRCGRCCFCVATQKGGAR